MPVEPAPKTLARLERGKASYNFAEGRLEEVVERALDVCRYRLEKERMRLRTDVESGLPELRIGTTDIPAISRPTPSL